MKVVCAWCGQFLGEKPGHADLPVSHGICADCERRLLEEAKRTM